LTATPHDSFSFRRLPARLHGKGAPVNVKRERMDV
jgi:hypothetical protein